jgi:hypothetical protein
MNRLSIQDRAKILHCLVEGNSMRSTSRSHVHERDRAKIHRTRVMCEAPVLLVDVGMACFFLATPDCMPIDIQIRSA